MIRPGVNVVRRSSPPASSSPTDTGVWFVAGFTQKGLANTPYLVRSTAEFETFLGTRLSYGVLWDCIDTFFHEGGSTVYVSRVVGPTPTVGTHTFQDASAGSSLIINAVAPGDWSTGISVQVVAGSGGGTFVLVVTYNGVEVERSPDLLDVAAAVAWGLNSSYIRVVSGGSGLDPAVVAATPLSAGTDDHGNATDATWKAGLDAHPPELGPGQVSMPGRSAAQAHLDTLAHAAARNRIAILDAPDSNTQGTLTAAATSARNGGNGEYGGQLFWPWAIVPGLTAGTTRTVPYSAVQAGIIARNDVSLSPNRAAAGVRGISNFAIGLSQTGWSDPINRQTLNENGVNVAVIRNGSVRTYGYRTLVNPTTDQLKRELGAARLVMAIVNEGSIIMESYMFDEFDGQKSELGHMGSDLSAMLAGWWRVGSLYGATPDEAFFVDTTSDQVNPPAQLANGEVHADLSIRTSPMGEMLVLTIVRRPITEAVV